MPLDSQLPLDVYVCFGVKRGTLFPHWMLMLRTSNAPRGTWYHTTGGPSQNREYQVTIQADKRVESQGIASKEFLGQLTARDINKVTAAAKRVPPQQCQTYVVALVSELEHRGLLKAGNAASLAARVQMSQRARSYAQQHPVPTPDLLPHRLDSSRSSPPRSIPQQATSRRGNRREVQPAHEQQAHIAPARNQIGAEQSHAAPGGRHQQQAATRTRNDDSSCCLVM